MKKTIFLLVLLAAAFVFAPQAVPSALACNGQCMAGGCPTGYIPEAQPGIPCPSGQSCCLQRSGSEMPNPDAAPTPEQVKALGLPATSQGTQPGAANVSPTGGSLNPLSATTIEAVLANIMKYIKGIAGTIAVIFIIIGGIMYMISGGSKEMTERAKKTLIFAITGLAIVLAAEMFLQEIKAVLSGSSPGSALQTLLVNILKLLLSIVGFLAIISMVIGSIWMLTAVGDDDRYELGKKTAGYSILGLVIALSALIIANQVASLIGGGSSAINTAANSAAMGGLPGNGNLTPVTPKPSTLPSLPGVPGI